MSRCIRKSVRATVRTGQASHLLYGTWVVEELINRLGESLEF
jgi:hypothetical protein